MAWIRGWKAISWELDMSRRWCYAQSRTSVPVDRRLPVFRVGGSVRMDEDDLRQWRARMRRIGKNEKD